MKTHPVVDPMTHYQIKLQGRVDIEWLQNFDRSVEIFVGEINQSEEISVLSVRTDQAGIVGLIRKIHALRMTLLEVKIVSSVI